MATLTEAYETFDAVPTNIRYSWSAFSRDMSTLVCTLWQHDFRGREYPLWVEDSRSRESPGYPEHYRQLRHAIDNNIPIVGFIVVANDPAVGNSVKEAHVDRLFHFEVTVDTPGTIVGRIVRVDRNDA
jgi:hypothetical protein